MRRALLLFAIVLGLAALVASLSRTRTESQPEDRAATTPARTTPTTPSAAPQAPASAPGTTLLFEAGADETLSLDAGRAAHVEVAVEEPGQVTIPSLGLAEPAEPLTPARFDVFVRSSGSHTIEFTPSAGDETRTVGTIEVSAPEE